METLKIKNLLVPFDHNTYCQSTLKVAEEISAKTGAQITLLSVVNPLLISGFEAQAFGMAYVMNRNSIGANYEVDRERTRFINETIENSKLSNSRFTTKYSIGNYTDAIIDLCKEYHFDMVIVPDFNKTALDRLFAEIDPIKIMKLSKTPVFAVNTLLANFNINSIALPIRNVVNWFDKIPLTVAIAKITGAKIYLIGVLESYDLKAQATNTELLELCENYLCSCGLEIETYKIYKSHNVFNQLIKVIQEKHADIIAISSPEKYSKIASIFNKTMYTTIVANSNIPVLGR